MDRVTAVVAVVSLVAVRLAALCALWLRLRRQSRKEQTERQHLPGAFRTVTGGGRLEIDEEWGEGRRLRVRITRTHSQGKDASS